MAKKALMLCGDFMEDYEASVPLHTLRALGVEVDCVSPGKLPGDKCLTAIHDYLGFELYTELPGRHFPINADFKMLRLPLCYDALIIPGGRFSELLSAHDDTIAVVSSFASLGKPIMATCHSSLILLPTGCLKGIKCTAFPSLKAAVELAGGTWVSPFPFTSAVYDNNIISSVGWPAHAELIRLLLNSMGAQVSAPKNPPSMLFLCADYVDDLEINIPFRAFGAFGCKVDAACPTKKKGENCVTAVYDDEGGQIPSEKRGHNFTVTVDWEEAQKGNYDCLVIPGGRSPELLVEEKRVMEMVGEFLQGGKVVAATGQGKLVLATARILKGKRCATANSMKAVVGVAGGEIVRSAESVVDGKLVTATGLEGMSQFIANLMKLMELKVTF